MIVGGANRKKKVPIGSPYSLVPMPTEPFSRMMPNLLPDEQYIIGNRMAGNPDLMDWLKRIKLVTDILRRNPVGLFTAWLDLQTYVNDNAAPQAVANQQIHDSTVVNDPYYISGQFTF